MKLQWAGAGARLLLLATSSLEGVNAMGKYMLEAMNSERVSGYGPVDKPSWVPTFFDESPPYNGHRISREGWTVTCSSEESDDYACQNVIDGSNTTSWRSRPVGDGSKGGHSITVDLGNHYSVSALVILPPIDIDTTGTDGLITHHEVWVSSDNKNWQGPVAYGMWPNTNRQRMSAFEPTSARYVKLTTNNAEAGESSWVGISELNLYATLYTIPRDDPTKLGLWGPTIDFPVVPVAGAQEASGNIVLWSSWASDQFHSTPGGQTAMARWNPFTNEVSKRIVTNTQHDMFCPGISIDGTGMMVVTGGNDASQTSLYDAGKDEWIKGTEMHLRRGYQASTTLADGRVFVIGGSWAGGSNVAKDGEVYDPATGNWTMLPGAKAKPMLTDDMEGPWRADNHGWLFGWKQNSVFQAGPSKAMNWYYVDGEGRVEGAGSRLDDDDSMSGNAVMFDAVKGKILTMGGSPDYDKSWATSNAHVITLPDEPGQKPDVQPAGTGGQQNNGTMHSERVFHTSVVLPDGKVFITGGQTFGVAFNEENVQLVPELYDPETNTFTQLAQNNVIRVYHSISILLPDGRVLNGGGGLCGNCSANHYDAQIFTPPYLLTKSGDLRPRPAITTPDKKLLRGGDTIQVGRTLKFRTNRRIASASLVRLCTTTHTVNTDQRRVPLVLRRRVPVLGRYHVTIPNDPGVVIPGYWMLFVMDENGTPSVAKTIMITSNENGKKTIGASDDEETQYSSWRSRFQIELAK
ncbi:putative galactose oxidase precursor [Sordaria brevicollis]|uniref:Galactose oxidase n=1 Tax=Sordaria brevicollis TaxID=83679 RepID=A0AAE0PJY0_SORBR|nr:putative galactose oxidase precursor [Sordaria brevicollis]